MTEVVINELGRQGDGVAPGPIYVPRALPGEQVKGRLEGDVLRDVRILTPSDRRVSAPCAHFKVCGGCALQHADNAFTAAWKEDVVRRALARVGLETEIRPIRTSPARTRRRAGFAARRTKSGALVGFHGRASDTIVAVPECHLLAPTLLAAVAVIAKLALVGASRKAVLNAMTTATETGLDVSVSGGKPLDTALRIALSQIVRETGLLRLTWNDELVATESAPKILFDGIELTLPPGAFLQATAEGETALRLAVLEISENANRAMDLFAGCGTFSLPLARSMDVHAVEAAGDMLAALDRGWRHATGLKTVSTETRDLFRRPLLRDEFRGVDVVVIDPPRAGAEAQVVELAHSGVPRIAHVSCNPQTFARDAETLVRAGYCLDWVQVIDQFRWSPHVELVARFSLLHIPR
ncbi:MAG: class I SAM-dependent RNA methyltransferase [Pseudomonadota bacterium]